MYRKNNKISRREYIYSDARHANNTIHGYKQCRKCQLLVCININTFVSAGFSGYT